MDGMTDRRNGGWKKMINRMMDRWNNRCIARQMEWWMEDRWVG